VGIVEVPFALGKGGAGWVGSVQHQTVERARFCPGFVLEGMWRLY
jgi:hypothetical protein